MTAQKAKTTTKKKEMVSPQETPATNDQEYQGQGQGHKEKEKEEKLTMYDYSYDYDYQRVAHTEAYLEQQLSAEKPPNEAALEKLGDYILYGKNPKTGKSPVQEKRVHIQARYSSYSRPQPLAIDELVANIYFDERAMKPVDYARYTNPRQTICREKDADVPGMVDLWKVIDHYQAILDNYEADDAEKDPNIREITSYEEYRIRHMLIQLRTQQYVLKDSHKPPIQMLVVDTNDYTTSDSCDWDVPGSAFCVAPLGLRYREGDNPMFQPLYGADLPDFECRTERFTLDFRKKEHVSALLQNWWDLYWQSQEDKDALIGDIIHTLYYYIAETDLSEEYSLILWRKMYRVSADAINEELDSKFGITFGDDWVSNLWVHKIPEMIAETATLHLQKFELRNSPEKWKQCNTCNEFLPRTAHYYTRRRQAADGFTGRCKKCAKKLREQRGSGKQ